MSEWVLTKEGKYIRKEFVFLDFTEAFAFMMEVAAEAERLDHHPEWSNVYNRVTVELTTHDAGGITQLDWDLADFMDSIA